VLTTGCCTVFSSSLILVIVKNIETFVIVYFRCF
jgi:hypothetical protein